MTARNRSNARLLLSLISTATLLRPGISSGRAVQPPSRCFNSHSFRAWPPSGFSVSFASDFHLPPVLSASETTHQLQKQKTASKKANKAEKLELKRRKKSKKSTNELKSNSAFAEGDPIAQLPDDLADGDQDAYNKSNSSVPASFRKSRSRELKEKEHNVMKPTEDRIAVQLEAPRLNSTKLGDHHGVSKDPPKLCHDKIDLVKAELLVPARNPFTDNPPKTMAGSSTISALVTSIRSNPVNDKDSKRVKRLSEPTKKPLSQTEQGKAPVPIRKKELWQIQKEALKQKFGSEGWNPRKKLSPDTLDGIRALHEQYPEQYTTPVLARKFEVSPEAIRRILKSKWRADPEKMVERKERWAKRHDRIWDQQAEIGLRPARTKNREPEKDSEDFMGSIRGTGPQSNVDAP